MKCYMGQPALRKDPMRNDQQIIIDTDAFIGLMHETDALHAQATAIYQSLKEQRVQFTTTSAVVTETATLLSCRRGQAAACKFLHDFIDSGAFPVIFVKEALYQQGLAFFKAQTKKGTSFTDCVNAATCHQLEMPWIFSFDQVYAKKFGLQLVELAQSDD